MADERLEFPTLAQGLRELVADPAELLSGINWEKRWCGNPNIETGEGTYYRFVERIETGERCLQAVVFYNVQWVPHHRNDFAPIYFYFDNDNRITRVLYDFFHHQVASVSESAVANMSVIVFAPWHAFRVNERHWAQNRFRSPYIRLKDDLLRKWWLLDGKPQFKLRSKWINPWHPNLFPENVPFQATFRDEAPCPVCGQVSHLDTMSRDGPVFILPLICHNGHRYIATYDAFSQQMDTTCK